MVRPTRSTTTATTTKPSAAGVKSKKTEPVARPAIGKDDKDLKEEKKQAGNTTLASASKKRKSPSSAATTSTESSTSAAKDPEHDPETIKNTEKNSKSKTKGVPTTSATTRSEDDHATTSTSNKRTKVSVTKPAVTLEKTVEELELPKVTKPTTTTTTTAAFKSGSKKSTSAQVSNEVAPSATKPADGLKSALKSTTSTKKSTKKPTTSTSAQDVEMKDAEFIHGFSSSSSNGGDSSDEDDSDVDMDAAAGEKATVKAKDLPSVVEGDKDIQEKLGKAKKRGGKEKGVLYLGRIPHGFYEDEMKAYFSQFGDVSRLRLARNKKTGASKHFAYIEMPNKSVAEITAETMHNYLLMGHILQCHVIPNDKIHPDLWIGANRKWRRVPSARLERSTFGKERTTEEQTKTRAKLATREKGRKDKIKAAGIDYDYEGFTA